MRTLKCRLVNVTIAFLAQLSSLAADSPELYIKNQSMYNRDIYVVVYPISFVFNGYNNYDLLARFRETNFPYDYINSNFSDIINAGQVVGLNHDRSSASNSNYGAIGYGTYKFEFRLTSGPLSFFDTCTVEWDSGWAGAPSPFGADLELMFVDNNNNPRIEFKWAGGDQTRIDDTLINKNIRA